MKYTKLYNSGEIETTSTYRPPAKRCELCEWYNMIDSGFGYCYRYPPKHILIKLIPIRYKDVYPEVAWCEKACGEYSQGKSEKLK